MRGSVLLVHGKHNEHGQGGAVVWRSTDEKYGQAMHLTHKIALCPTPEQVDYFNRAGGTARRVWNWALGEWKRQYAAGQKPNAMALKKQFNAIKYSDLNAAINLKRLATATALPVASPSSNGGTTPGMVPAVAGKVTPARYECGQQDTSGQEKNRAHLRALS